MNDEMLPVEGEIMFYTAPAGTTRVEVFYQDETFWLTLNRIAELFGTTKQAISYHLRQIYESGELGREATVKGILTVQQEGARQRVTTKYGPDNLEERAARQDSEVGCARCQELSVRHSDRRR